jgi:hypothetical protein
MLTAALSLEALPFRISSVVTGFAVGVAVGFLWLGGHVFEIALAGVLGAGLFAATLLSPRPNRHAAMALVAVGLSVHFAAVVVLYTGLQMVGLDGFVTGDDRAYAQASWGVAESLRGDPSRLDLKNLGYLLGPYVYLGAAVFFLLGTPNVLVLEMLNAVLAVVMMLFIFNLTGPLFGSRPATLAAILVVGFPALIVWTSLNLKDSLALALVSFSLWSISRFQLAPSWRLFALFAISAVGVWAVRTYLVLLPLFAMATALVLTPDILTARRTRVRVVLALYLLFCALLVADVGGNHHVVSSALRRVEVQREGLAADARTAMVDPIVRLPAADGDTFVVGPRLSPGVNPRVLRATLGSRIVLASSYGGGLTAPSGALVVTPGDVIVVGEFGQTPAPAAQVRELTIPSTRPLEIVPAIESDRAIFARTLEYLPKGLAYALLAPFPWAQSRTVDLATIPDMLLWYVVALFAPFALWTGRRRLDLILPMFAFVLIGLLVLAGGEGNTGTLYRHRAMIIPAAAVLAAPGLAAAPRALRRLVNLGRPGPR